MVNLLELPLAVQDPRVTDQLRTGLSAWENQLLNTAGDQLGLILSPLATAKHAAAMEILLSDAAIRTIQVLLPVVDVLSGEPGKEQRLHELLTESVEDIEKTIRASVDLLGEEATEQVFGALSSQQGMSSWMFEGLQRGGSEAQRVAAMMALVMEPAIKGQLCIAALAGILRGKLTEWTREAVLLLAAGADDHFAEVEDRFLEVRSGFDRHPSNPESEPVSVDDTGQLLRL